MGDQSDENLACCRKILSTKILYNKVILENIEFIEYNFTHLSCTGSGKRFRFRPFIITSSLLNKASVGQLLLFFFFSAGAHVDKSEAMEEHGDIEEQPESDNTAVEEDIPRRLFALV